MEASEGPQNDSHSASLQAERESARGAAKLALLVCAGLSVVNFLLLMGTARLASRGFFTMLFVIFVGEAAAGARPTAPPRAAHGE